MGKLFSSVPVEMIKFVLCGVVCFLLASYNLPLCLFFTPVGSVIKSRLQTQTELMHRSFTQMLNAFSHHLPSLLSLTRIQNLLPIGQQGPSALDHGGGGL